MSEHERELLAQRVAHLQRTVRSLVIDDPFSHFIEQAEYEGPIECVFCHRHADNIHSFHHADDCAWVEAKKVLPTVEEIDAAMAAAGEEPPF